MKQTILITTGTIVILAACGVWVYLLIFGTPDSAQEFFTNFGGEETVREFRPSDGNEADATLAIERTALEQLTTRPVAGFAFIESGATSSPDIIYAERGTGHVYTIDLANGTETRTLGVTYAAITDAAFAPDGSAVVLIAEDGYNTTAYLETISDGDGAEHVFPSDATNIAFVSDREVRFTRVENDRLVGYAYDRIDRTSTERFSLPFTDATVLWMPNQTLVYNTPAPHHSGGLYRIDGNMLTRIGATGYALSALAHRNASTYAITRVDTESDRLITITRSNGDVYTQPITALPEKCAFGETDGTVLWCGAPVTITPRTYQADWYKGLQHSEDLLWRVDTTAQEAVVLADPLQATGRHVDVYGLTVDASGTQLMFKNKIDDALWLFRIPAAQPETPTDDEDGAEV